MRSIAALALVIAALVAVAAALPKQTAFSPMSLTPGFTPAAKLTARGSRATFYDTQVGRGSCGWFNMNDQHVVAMNAAQYSPELCGRCIVVSSDDDCVRVNAEIVDLCPGCPMGGLDTTPGLFQQFAPLDKGVLSLKWAFCEDAPAPPADLSHCNGGGSSGNEWEGEWEK
ncbi:hypothetical protein H9P43_007007 [Blastocladiella emersonii ATCC 22665]|nr:hypothetical protein H9P43_007007 [Blastocladiella emersonii ATCC 22665]